MVQGNPFEAQTTDLAGRPLQSQNGEPKVQYFFAVAFPKSALTGSLISQGGQRTPIDILDHCRTAAAAAWPAGAYRSPQFAWKIQDGDQPGADGMIRDCFAGCWVFKFSSGFPVQVVAEDPSQVITDPSALRRGYFVRVLFQYTGNGQTVKPGMYCNAYKVQRVAFGEEILTGPSASDIFGGNPVQALPSGASATPFAPSAAPAAPAAAGPSPAALGATPASPAPAAAPPTPLAPAHDFLRPAGPVGPASGVPVAPAAVPAAPAAPPALTMTAKAAGATLEAFRAQGWTEDALIAHGYAVRG
jgi:hypothetical protein